MSEEEKLTSILLTKNVKMNFHTLCIGKNFYGWIKGLIPEIVACKKCQQNTPWHIYNVLDHILVSVEEINKLTAGYDKNIRKFFAYAMFLHDLGKPKTKKTIDVNGKQIDTFKDHQEESEKIAKRVLPQLGFDDKEVQLMCLLILNHDLFNKIVKIPTRADQKQFSRKLIEELVNDFNKYGNGIDILNDIVLIGIADNMAQNPELTAKPLEILNETRVLLDIMKNGDKQL